MNVSDVFEKLLPNPRDCRRRAEDLAAAYPKKTPLERAEILVRQSRRKAMAVGVVSGLPATPFTMVPAATADVALVLRAEAQMAGVVAALLAPDTLNDGDTFMADILAIVFPSSVSHALRTVGVQAGRQTSKVLIRKYISKDVLKIVIRFVLRYLGVKLTQRAILSKAIPIVGGVIGGTWNWLEVRRVGGRAVAYHSDEPIDAADPGAGAED